MYKSVTSGIEKHRLDTRLHKLHKEKINKSDFGMDNTNELIDEGFGLYSTANTKTSIGPVKTEYYRIGFVRSGSAEYTIGLEPYNATRDTIIFGFPGQVFSLQNPTNDFFAYYMLFTENFIAESLLTKKYKNQFPFLSYSGIQCFQVNKVEADEIENIYFKMNTEVKARKSNISQVLQLYIQLIFITAGRCYNRKIVAEPGSSDNGALLYNRFLKSVSEHFVSVRKVADYAAMLHVSADHLNRIIKAHSDKTAHELIDEMILREAKSYLLHSQLSIAEIAYNLSFSDPSHFNKFFKKLSGTTPLQYRNKSE